MDKPQIISISQLNVDYTLYDAKWIPCSAKFIVLGGHAKGTGALNIFELTKGEINLVSQSIKTSALKCGTFGASALSNRVIATGDFEGQLQLWDVEDLTQPVYKVKAHDQIINTIDGAGSETGTGAPEIATGSRDGTVKIWDTRQKNTPVAVIESSDAENKRDCWAVAFGNMSNAEERCVCTGYDNGDVKMFDLKNMSVRWETNIKNGICGLEYDRKSINMNKLVVTTLESKFHVFDLRTQHPKKGFTSLTEKAHKSTIWTVRHLPQNRDIFMTAGGSGSLCLWKYKYPAKRVTEDGIGVVGSLTQLQNVTLSSQPISSFDWCSDKQGLSVCTSFDQTIRVLIVTKLNRNL